MESLSTELKAVIARRLHSASRAEVLAIASALTADEAPLIFGAQSEPQADLSVPFVKIGHAGEQLDKDATDWEAVLDQRTGLMWTRHYAGKRAAWAEAIEQPKGLTIAGYSDWEAPTIRRQLSIVDYERSSPTIDTDYFEVESNSDWCWTRTPLISSPRELAWCVHFNDGLANWTPRSYERFVRACRASQPLVYWR